MTNPTSNFGWQMPTSTDLVTDLPADFEVFGQAVDTSLADLKGGTTGQVLSKASNTNMDFTWVTTDDANAIQNSIVDAKGDLVAASANDTPARLAVGNNGETLVADSSTSTGLRYTAGTVSDNPLLNSSFQVWQRGTSFAISSSVNTYTADRWACYRGATGATVSRQVTNDTTNLPFIQYAARLQRDSGNTSTVIPYLAQSVETVNSIRFAGKTVTVSFYARAGANYSATSNLLQVQVMTGTGTDQNWLGYTGSAFSMSRENTLTTSWQRFTQTTSAPIPVTATEFSLIFSPTTVNGTAGANDYFEITGVQIDIGNVALPFRTNAGTIQGELAACQRYYYRTPTGVTAYPLIAMWGNATSTTNVWSTVVLPVTMRTQPSSVDFSTLRVFGQSTGVYNAISAVSLDTGGTASTHPQMAGVNLTSTGLTANAVYGFGGNNSLNSYIGFSAEL